MIATPSIDNSVLIIVVIVLMVYDLSSCLYMSGSLTLEGLSDDANVSAVKTGDIRFPYCFSIVVIDSVNRYGRLSGCGPYTTSLSILMNSVADFLR